MTAAGSPKGETPGWRLVNHDPALDSRAKARAEAAHAAARRSEVARHAEWVTLGPAPVSSGPAEPAPAGPCAAVRASSELCSCGVSPPGSGLGCIAYRWSRPLDGIARKRRRRRLDRDGSRARTSPHGSDHTSPASQV